MIISPRAVMCVFLHGSSLADNWGALYFIWPGPDSYFRNGFEVHVPLRIGNFYAMLTEPLPDAPEDIALHRGDAVLGIDALLFSSYLLPLTFLTYDETREDFGTLALMYGEVFLLNKRINALVKGLTTRNRPFVYDENCPAERKYTVNARHSFYSGHVSVTASNSFFTAKVFSEYLTDNTAKVLIWSAAVLIPAVTGFSRINTHNHFPTDVIVGYIVGAAIGYLIPELHKYENESNEPGITDQIIHKPIFGFQISF